MNKLKQPFSSRPSASSVSGLMMADGIAAPLVTQAFPSACTLVALTKGAVAGRMKMLRCMCDSGWAVVNISSQASPRPGRGEPALVPEWRNWQTR